MQLEKKIRPEVSKVSAAASSRVSVAASLISWPVVAARTVPVAGRRARLRLEAAVWDGLDEAARREGRPVADLCTKLDAERSPDVPLTTAIRTYVLNYFREASAC